MGFFSKIFGVKKSEGKTITGGVPVGRPVAVFVPRRDFHSKVFRSWYVRGQRYTLREGNTLLEREMKEWESQGFIDVL